MKTHFILQQEQVKHSPFAEAAVSGGENKNRLCQMKAGWTFGHYPPCKFLLLGFPEERLQGKE